MTDDLFPPDLIAAFLDAAVVLDFWLCPVDGHSDRRDVTTVEWRGDVAHCTWPGCTNTNQSEVKS